MTNQTIDSFSHFITQYTNFLIIGHKEPDGDCISSCLMLAAIIKKRHKKVSVLSDGPFLRPETRSFESLFLREMPNLTDEEKKSTAVIIADCSTYDRLGSFENDLRPFPFFIIDHHKTATPFGGNSIIDSSSPATAYLVQQLYESFFGDIPQDLAPIAFFGIATDTGFFRFLEQKDAGVFSAAARLVCQGVNPKKIYTQMTGGKTFESRKLLGILLARTELYFSGKLALTWETYEESETVGRNGRDSDALYNLLLSVENISAVAVIRQESLEKCTIGLRSQDTVDVSQIASSFGGGGHKNASGASTQGTITNIVKAVLQEFEKVL